MKSNKNFNWGLVIGAAAGAAAGWLIYSKKGKEIRQTASTRMAEAGQEIKDRVTTEFDNLSTKAKTMFSNGKETVEEEIQNAKKKAKNMAEAAKS